MRGVPQHGFYKLAFASQMIVWAVRKRLHWLARDDSDSCVIEAFRLVDLDDAYDSLMSVVDALVRGPAKRIQLHGVACPCLPPHEIDLLNALAYLQQRDDFAARPHITALLCAPVVRFVLPELRRIVDDFDARGLRLAVVDASSEVYERAARARALH